MNLALAVAAVIVLAITLYAWSGLADFGASGTSPPAVQRVVAGCAP